MRRDSIWIPETMNKMTFKQISYAYVKSTGLGGEEYAGRP